MTAVYASDNGAMFWPPECELIRWDKPVAQAWEKWEFDYERIKHRNWQQKVRCCGLRLAENRYEWGAVYLGGLWWRRCDAVLEGTGAWREHCLTEHPGREVRGEWANQRWVWEMLGSADVWDGRPVGWCNLLDGDDPSVRQWEQDALLLGTAAADHWWVDGQVAS